MRLGISLLTQHCKMWHKGKHRKPWKITVSNLLKLRFDMLNQERNMEVLSNPYLTVEQSRGHMKEQRPTPKEIIDKFANLKEIKFTKYVTLEDRLLHLKVKEGWD